MISRVSRMCVATFLHLTLRTLHFTLHALPGHQALRSLHLGHATRHMYTLHSALYTLDAPHFALDTPHSTLHTQHSTLETWHCARAHTHTHLTLYWHFTLHTVHSIMYAPHTTLYSPHALHFALYTFISHFILHFCPKLASASWNPSCFSKVWGDWNLQLQKTSQSTTPPSATASARSLVSNLCTSQSGLHTLHSRLYTPHLTRYVPHSTLKC